MDRYKETFDSWNKVAQLYHDKFMNLDLYNESYDTFCDAVTTENPLVLELGCGPGNITRYLLSKRPDFRIEAIDVAPNMIQLAQQNISDADFKVMDVREIHTIQKQFNAIIGGFCIPYLSETDVSKLVADCNRLLVHGGILYLSFVAGDYNDSGYQKGSSGDRTYCYFHGLESIRKTLEKQEFTVKNLMTVKYPRKEIIEIHTMIISAKS